MYQSFIGHLTLAFFSHRNLYLYFYMNKYTKYNFNREKCMVPIVQCFHHSLKPYSASRISIYQYNRWRWRWPNLKILNSVIWSLHFFPIGFDSFKFLLISIISIEKKCMVQNCPVYSPYPSVYIIKFLLELIPFIFGDYVSNLNKEKIHSS